MMQEIVLGQTDHIGIIFDATPRQGDFFAMVSCHVALCPKTKTAKARQLLIHCSNVEGSLSQHTLAAEVSHGLHARNVKHSKAVVACNDGCYTNGAAHDKFDKVTDICKKILADSNATPAHRDQIVKRFVAICISHCLSNAGDKAGFVILDLFWTLLQKVFSHSDSAKVSAIYASSLLQLYPSFY